MFKYKFIPIITAIALFLAGVKSVLALQAYDVRITQRNWDNTINLLIDLPLPAASSSAMLGMNGTNMTPTYMLFGSGLSFDPASITVSVASVPVSNITGLQSLLNAKASTTALSAVAFSGAYADLSGKPSLATVATTGNYYDLLNRPATGTGGTVMSVAMSSSDFSIVGSPVTTTGTFIANLNTSGVATGTYSGVTVNNKGIVTTGTTRGFGYTARTLDTCFQISATRDVLVNYSVDIAATLSLVTGQTGTVFLEVSDNSGCSTNTQELSRAVNGNTGTLTIGLNITQNVTGQVSGVVPAGKYVKLRTANTVGTPTFNYRSGQEVTL